MAPDERDAFGNPIDRSPLGAGDPPLVPNLGRFAEPLSPTPAAELPSPVQGPPVPPPAAPMPAFPPTAPGATAALVLGILGLFLFLPAPIAWWRGRATVRAIDKSGGRLGGRSQAMAGQVLGILGTAFFVLGVVSRLISHAG